MYNRYLVSTQVDFIKLKKKLIEYMNDKRVLAQLNYLCYSLIS